ncbi:MAG: type 4a pilus biogenesis protein PilO [Candidatus Omnitrophica bacterium]|nr:type 4a pilus biogenesis protein PilO [Candidatus Omnitrophota bacterium]
MAKVNLKSINKTQAWILWGVGLAIVLGLFTVSIKPRFKKYEEIKAEVLKEEENLAEAKALISKKEEYEKMIEAVNKKIKYYEGKLPNEKETDQLLEDLARIATDAKIKYQFIKPGSMTSLKEEKIDLPYYRWPITMKLTCGYHELGLYINQLEIATRFIKIDNLSIDTGENVFQHVVTLNLSTYVVGR